MLFGKKDLLSHTSPTMNNEICACGSGHFSPKQLVDTTLYVLFTMRPLMLTWQIRTAVKFTLSLARHRALGPCAKSRDNDSYPAVSCSRKKTNMDLPMKPYRRALPLLVTPLQYWQGKLLTLAAHALIPTGCLIFITAPISAVLALLSLYWAPPHSDWLIWLARWIWLPAEIGTFLCLIVPLLVIITNTPAKKLGTLLCRLRRSQTH